MFLKGAIVASDIFARASTWGLETHPGNLIFFIPFDLFIKVSVNSPLPQITSSNLNFSWFLS